MVKELMAKHHVSDFKFVFLNKMNEGNPLIYHVGLISHFHTVPSLFINGKHIGGVDRIKEIYNNGEMKRMFDEGGISYDA